jgi:AcrR family transcriptional regulator
MSGNNSTQRHETAQVILEEANELFYSKGYEKTSMREIAERVGISKAAMYHHFENKEAILYTLCTQGGEMMDDSMQRAIARNEESGASIRDQLADILHEYTTTYLQHKNFNKILLHDIESLPEEKKKVIQGYEKVNVHRLQNYLKRMMDRGHMRPCELTSLTFTIFASVHWLYFWFQPDGELSLRSVVENIADVFWNGLNPVHS